MNAKSYKKIICAYFVSVLGVAGISIGTNIQDNRDIKSSILIMLIVLIPAGYSLIPLIKEAILGANRSKYRLTNEIFTDRKDDLKHLLTILSSQQSRPPR